MKRSFVLLAWLAAVVSLAATGVPLSERYQQAYEAWDRGDYVAALDGFKQIVTAPDGGAYVERIAILTGELYRVQELTPDGRQPRLGPTGRYASYETGTPAITRLMDIADAPKLVAELPGSGLAFSPAGDKVAYSRLKPVPELTKARADLDQLQAQVSPDRQKVAEAQRIVARLAAKHAEIVLRDIATGREQVLADGGLLKGALLFSSDGREVWFVGTAEQDARGNALMATAEGSQPRTVVAGAPFLTSPVAVPGGRYLLYTVSAASPFSAAAPAGPAGGGRGQAPGGGRGGQSGTRQFALVSLADGTATTFTGSSPDVSRDGSVLAFVSQTGAESSVQVVKLGAKPSEPVVVKKSADRIASVSVSPDGSRVAYDMPYTRNTEIFSIKTDLTDEVRVSREIQPDRAPRFLTNTTLIAIKGEARHSRSYLYDLSSRHALRLFHNNTVRTIAPEYEWLPSRDGQRLLIVAERDGDTISPERGVYLLDVSKTISREDLVRRLDACLAAERDLRQRGAAMFQPIAAQVKALVDRVSITRIYEYESALFDFDSKAITQPGNQRAGEYIFETLKSFGYEPEYQWFTARGRIAQQEIRTANVLATLKGTTHPDLVYVLSSHYDSNERGPGADDNSSATAVLLETARVMAKAPMPATIVFAAFTGEEAGLLGSREFVRQAVEKKMKLAGALNNDMIGWTNDHRLDNTIRYSNPGIRDLQHAASFLFSRMITYDARYFKATDAAAYYEAYGDIVGGIGSYPVLGNPHYHQPTDLLETVNHQLLVEATKANVASIAGLASSPSRLTGVKAERTKADGITVSWTPAPEKGIVKYLVAFGPAGKPMAQTLVVTTPRAQLPAPVKSGEIVHVAVKAVNAGGLAGWDWARTTVAARAR